MFAHIPVLKRSIFGHRNIQRFFSHCFKILVVFSVISFAYLTPVFCQLNIAKDTIAAYQALKSGLAAHERYNYDTSRIYYLQAAEGYRQYGLSLKSHKANALRNKMLFRSFECLLLANGKLIELGNIEAATAFDRQTIDSAYLSVKRLFAQKQKGYQPSWRRYDEYKGLLLFKSGQYDSASVYLNQCLTLTLAESGPLSRDAGSTYNLLGNLRYIKGDFLSAIEMYQQSMRAYRHALGPTNKHIAGIYHNIGNIYGIRGEIDKAIESHEHGLRLYEALNGPTSIKVASSILALSLDYRYKGDLDNAYDLGLKAIAIYQALNMEQHIDMALCYYNLAFTLDSKGEFDKAIDYFYQSLRLSEQLLGKNHPEIAPNYLGLAGVYSSLGESDKAVQLLEQYFKQVEHHLPPLHYDLGIAHTGLAVNYMQLNQFDQAKPHAHQALTIYRNSLGEKSPNTASAYNNIGIIYREMGKFDSAAAYFDTALAINQQLAGNKYPNVGDTWIEYARLFWYQGKKDSALHYYQKSMNLFIPGFDSLKNHEPVQILDLKVLENIIISYQRSLLFIRKPEQLKACLHLTYIADRVIDSLRKVYTFDNDKIALGRFAHNAYINGILAADLLNTPESIEQAFYYAEKGKGTVLYQNMNESKALKLSNIPDSLVMLDKAYKIDIAFYTKALADQRVNCPDCDSALMTRFTNDLFRQHLAYQSFKEKLERQYPQFYALKYQRNTSTIHSLQQALITHRPQSVVICYSLSDSNLIGILIRPDTVLIHRQFLAKSPFKKLNVLKVAIARLNRTLSQPLLVIQPTNEFKQSAEELYQLLIKPFESVITGKDLIIIPDGELNRVPFEVLLKPSKNSKMFKPAPDTKQATTQEWASLPYLTLKHNISYHYSANLLLESWKQTNVDSTQPKGLLALAPIFDQGLTPLIDSLSRVQDQAIHDYYQNQSHSSTWATLMTAPTALSPLPGSAKEVEVLAAQFSAKQLPVHVFKRQAATKANLLSLNLKQYQYIHFASHAFTDEDQPERSAIFFAPTTTNEADSTPELEPDSLETTRSRAMSQVHANAENQLTGPEMYQLSLGASLVTLSACQTGQGKLRPGEGIIGLTRGLLYAGARSLVVSQWKVNDASTALLMEHFYRHLLANHSKAQALQMAKRQLIQQSAYACPYYWAPFILIGP